MKIIHENTTKQAKSEKELKRRQKSGRELVNPCRFHNKTLVIFFPREFL